MPTVLLNTDDLTVFGGPEIVELSVDIGPEGDRGSKIFVGDGNPNDNPGNIIGTVQYNDMYIDTATSLMYQYISEPSGDTWEEVLSLAPVLFSSSYATTFTDGEATIDIPLPTISSNLDLSTPATRLNVQFNIEHTKPIASSVEKSIVSVSSVNNLRLSLNAVDIDFTSLEAAKLSGEKTVQVFITLIPSGG
jgi:hypothetical protein